MVVHIIFAPRKYQALTRILDSEMATLGNICESREGVAFIVYFSRLSP